MKMLEHLRDRNLRELTEEINRSPHIGEITRQDLELLIAQHSIRFCYQDDVFVGFGAWMPIGGRWVELGPIYVAQEFRGQGLGKQITEGIIRQNRHLNQYAVTRNPAMKAIFIQNGFEPRPFFRLPFVVQRFIVGKLSVRKLLRFAAKRSPESIGHFVKIAPADTDHAI